MAKVWDTDLETGEKIVLLTLADFANPDGTSIWPSKGTIARRTSMSPRTVQTHLGALRDRGLIRIVKPSGQHRPNEYAIVVENLMRRIQGGQDVSSDGDQGSEICSPTEAPGEQPTAPRGATVAPDPSSTDPPERSSFDRRSNTSEAYEAGFAECWEHYPRKEARKAALKAYQARRRAGVSAQELLDATEAYAEAMVGTERQYRKIGATFYGPNEHWKDYLPEADKPLDTKATKPVCPDHGPGACFFQSGQGWQHVTADV